MLRRGAVGVVGVGVGEHQHLQTLRHDATGRQPPIIVSECQTVIDALRRPSWLLPQEPFCRRAPYWRFTDAGS